MVIFSSPGHAWRTVQLGWLPSLTHYQNIFTGDIYLPLLWLSVRVAFSVALFATLLAFPGVLPGLLRREAGIALPDAGDPPF
jgi:ABC-type spermidine/putrescine transport system permease subunit I